jgi:hypothetical protein
MTSILKNVESDSQLRGGPPLASEVQETLRLILESHPFRTSKQCQDLLRYIVNHSLNGDDASLKERIIGAEVFLRKPSYDTNQDPVVRVRAADVRKRLAQYYQSPEAGKSTLHIELQPGSYRAHFRYDRPAQGEHSVNSLVTVSPEPEQPSAVLPVIEEKTHFPLRRPFPRIAALIVTLLLLTGAFRWVVSNWTSPQERFWAPMISGKQPVLIYLGANVAYIFSSGFLADYRAKHGLPNNGPEFFPDLPHGSTVRADDLVAVRDTFVTTADVAAIVQLTTLLRDWKRPFVLRSGSDLSFGDLRNRPTVMIGAFNNEWTLELNNDLPFSFQHGNEILNRYHPDRSWSVPVGSRPSATVDYALITRLLSSKTGGPSITVAGIGEYGTLAAAEFLANPDQMHELLKSAPIGWESKNMQAVLRVKVVGYQPVAVDVVATNYW